MLNRRVSHSHHTVTSSLNIFHVQKGLLFTRDTGFMQLVDKIYSNNYLHCRDQLAGFDCGLTYKPSENTFTPTNRRYYGDASN